MTKGAVSFVLRPSSNYDMKLNGLLDLGRSLPAFDELAAGLREGRAPAAPLAVYHAARPYLVAALARQLNRPLLIITPRTNRARQWIDELRAWLPDEFPVHNFADPDALSYERIPWVAETRQRRLEALVSLLTWEASGADEQGSGQAGEQSVRDTEYASRITHHAPIVVASARALMQMTLPLREMRAALRTLRPGQPFDLNRMLASWVGLGYEAAAVVDAPGQFSRRGGIVDIWPPNLRKPLRIELFGDEVDSLRTFDPSTQRTLARVTEVWIGPASEALPKIGERVAEKLRGIDLAACHPPARIEFEREIEQLAQGSGCRNLEWYIPYLYSQPGCLIDYLPAAANPWLIVEDAGELMAALSDLEGQAEQLARDLHAAGDVPAVLGAALSCCRGVARASLGAPGLVPGPQHLRQDCPAADRSAGGCLHGRPALRRPDADDPGRDRKPSGWRRSRGDGQPAGAAAGRSAGRGRPCRRAGQRRAGPAPARPDAGAGRDGRRLEAGLWRSADS